MKKHTVLVVEDEATISRLIDQILTKEGYNVKKASSLKMAQPGLAKPVPDLIIMDRRLPDGDGLELCRQIKNNPRLARIPVMFLTSKGSTADKVTGLKMGGDDYLTKPFQVDELLARVEVLLRRTAVPAQQSAALAFADIEMDVENHTCTAAGAEVKLWPKEFELLRIFLSRPGKVISKEFLSQQIWGHDFISTSRAVEMSVHRLKNKLGAKGGLLLTIKGYGFKLADK
ncbi:MAG: response regulator transcription factor [Elusimicrobiaceae bacterium]|nr:response regulator transcription factor [Elusimicrobiaceae bacterium]